MPKLTICGSRSLKLNVWLCSKAQEIARLVPSVLEYVNSYKYLGVEINISGSFKLAITNRIQKAHGQRI